MSEPKFDLLEGNSDIYSCKNVKPLEHSPLKGMDICFLGSSITLGYGSLNESFADFLAKHNQTNFYKEAVNGTTLVQESDDDESYVTRSKRIDRNRHFDLFVCQLSTNDASKNKELGGIYDKNPNTICGAINTIIEYVRKTWGCPILFYSNCYFKSDSYLKIVETFKKIAVNKNVGFIDLYTDKRFNDISNDDRTLFMADALHPTKAGYLKWWLLKIEEFMFDFIKNKR